MKRAIYILFAAMAIEAGMSCENTKNNPSPGMDAAPAKDSTANVAADSGATRTDTAVAASPYFTVEGTVGTITNGKDGYMADLKGTDGKEYSMTVSILRLQDKFVRFNTGEKVSVSGDTIHLGEKVNVLVRDFSKLK